MPETAEPTSIAEWSHFLSTYRAGEVWAVWANESRIVQTCRLDPDGYWATPIGHMQEAQMRTLGWIKADGSEAA